MKETNARGVSYWNLIMMRLTRPALWKVDLHNLEEYANYNESRKSLEMFYPAIKELPA